MPRRTQKITIGLDIGRDSVKLVKVAKKANKVLVLDCAYRKYSQEGNSSGLILEYISQALNSILEPKEIKKAAIYSTISGRNLCVRVIRLPFMPKEELYQAISSKVHKYMSLDSQKVVFSFSVLGEIQERGVTKLEVVFAAIQKDFFNENLELLHASGIEPKVITSACLVGGNLIKQLGLNTGINSVMLINIETRDTDLTVYQGDHFIFTRNIPIGREDLGNISNFQNPSGESQNEALALCKEIELTAQHYYQNTHGKRLNKCILFGEGSGIEGLVEFLDQKLDMPVEKLGISGENLEVKADLTKEFKEKSVLYAQALGVSLTGPNDINLLSSGKTTTGRRDQFKKLLSFSKMTTFLIIGFVVLAIFVVGFFKGINFYYRSQIKFYKTKIDSFQSQTAQMIQIKRNMDILDFKRKFYLELIKARPSYPVIIAEICRAIPSKRVILDDLRFNRESKRTRALDDTSSIKFTIIGRVVGREEVSSITTKFVLALEKSGYFENISASIKAEGLLGARTRLEPLLTGASKQSEDELPFIVSGFIRKGD